jgi:hypothetical protein
MDTGGFHSGSLAVGDFNGDGFPDIAVSNEMSNTISVFLNDGKGHFSNPIITPVQISALNVGPIAAGDLNEDGRTDLVLGTIAGSQANIALFIKRRRYFSAATTNIELIWFSSRTSRGSER